VIGSANLDARSTELNEENEIGIADSALGRAVEEGFLADLARSREIRLEEWKRRSILERIGERLSVLLVEQY
jgi:cardiolipin synthase